MGGLLYSTDLGQASERKPAWLQELCKSEAVKKAALKELQTVGRAKGLKGFEETKALHLEPEPFTVENEMLTPSFKLKRAPLLKHYKKEVDAMYAAVKASARG